MRVVSFVIMAWVLFLVPSLAFSEGVFVAGVVPSQRPVDAPEVVQIDKGVEWYNQALHGVEKPYPGSLRFLEDQGNWFNPFTKAGMTGPYDIRKWH